MNRVIFSSIVASALLVGNAAGEAPARVRMATTTSTENSGLLDVLLPSFERARARVIEVHVVSVGTGKALKLAERCDVDLRSGHLGPPLEDYLGKVGPIVGWVDLVAWVPPR